ncbi:MAG: Veg family protein [Firmicutes bacterium]|nr:Veg family protein [Bacillota bacterium]MCL2770779.1 Veg family protein [Bacillota bacterium]
MKQKPPSIEVVREKIKELVGQDIKIKINKGRKKIETYFGQIKETYPQVFTLSVETAGQEQPKNISATYTDVLCGNVVINKKTPYC